MSSKIAERATPSDSTAAPDSLTPPPRRKRRPVWVAAAVILVALGALLAWYVAANLRDTERVVALRNDVSRGAVITADDLVMIDILPDPVLATVPAAQLAEVVGQRTAVELSAGGLLVPAALVKTVTPARGESVVGLALGAGQLPVTPLQMGDKVRLISTPRDQDDPPVSAPVMSVPAVVVTAATSEVTTAVLVDVVVTESDATRLAGLVATGRVALILDNLGE